MIMNKLTYEDVLNSKICRVVGTGFDIDESKCNPYMFLFQKYCTRKSLQAAKFALFENCGLGKTLQQLDWSQKVVEHTNKPVLILNPLAVTEQTIEQGVKFGIPCEKLTSNNPKPGIYTINYEQLDNIDCDIFGGVVLDESSILKNFEGSFRNLIIEKFKNTPFKLACTATPAPNDPVEIGNHAEFLGYMSRNEMLAMYFIHDGGNTSKWRLKKHAEKDFWRWVSSWAIMISKPSDIGFSDEGYELPKLNIIEHVINTPKKNNGLLFNSMAVSATELNPELKATLNERMQLAADIVNNSEESFLVWAKLNDESKLLKSLINNSVEVTGSEKQEIKETKLLGFAKDEYKCLITKTKIASFGLNYQNCHNMIFASPDFSFESLYQAIRRELRFGQTHEVNVHIIVTDTMQNVRDSLEKKQKAFDKMQHEMSLSCSEFHNKKFIKPIISTKKHLKMANSELFLGDCVTGIRSLPDNSIDFSIFSPPFAELYTYSDSLEDMGNSKDYKEFLLAFRFLVSELKRVVKPGRNVAVHCMDLPIQKGKEGFIGRRDFSNYIRIAFESKGFIWHDKITIWKNPVTEMQRTKALGLLHKQVKKDATMSRTGFCDYLMVFRNEGENTEPVWHQDTDSQKPNYLPVDLWQKIASPVWMDIDYGNTLNMRNARDIKDEKHICPLQLDTIDRALLLWSNEGETVLTPFGGIGSELYQAVLRKRKAIGFELKQSYFNEACKNIKIAEMSKMQTSLF